MFENSYLSHPTKLVIFILTVLITACDPTYSELEKKYSYDRWIKEEPIQSSHMFLMSADYPYVQESKRSATIRLGNDSIYIKSTFNDQLKIPTSNILGCGTTYFECTSWWVYLLLEDKTQISIRNAPEVFKWCYDNQLPAVTFKHKHDLIYGAGSLAPEFSASWTQTSWHDYNRNNSHYKFCPKPK